MKNIRNVELKEINRQNYVEILKLKVADSQTGFVATNAVSLAQAHFHEEAWYRGIYDGELAVGFVMLEIDTQKPEYYLWRFMIAEAFQNQGYGTAAVEALIKVVRVMPRAEKLLLSYVPGEGSPELFYHKSGFRKTGEVEEGEVVMSMDL